MRSARFPLQLPVRYRRLGERLWRHGTTENISCSGVLFRSNDLLPVEGDVELRLELPTVTATAAPSEVSCRGRVVRTVSPSDDQPWQAAAIMIDNYDFLRHAAASAQVSVRGDIE